MPHRDLLQLVWGSFPWLRVGRSLLLVGLVVYGYLLWLGWFQSERLIFLPQPASYRDGDAILKLTTSDGLQISAVYLPNPAAAYTLLYSHGNAEDLGDILPRLVHLQQAGFAVLAYDYRGYGTSEGIPSEAGAYKDIEAAYTYLVILESTFVTAFRVLTRIPLLPFDRFDNLSRMAKINCPLLILHGTHDRLIPFWHAETLYQAARDPKRLVPIEGAGHNNLLEVAGERYVPILHQFVAELVDPHVVFPQ
jgi:fermentation-respiration switch protein FrsA (DUF1100 family)